jgi:alpha,alpha-trehalose-phosphate synthase [UDP-forming]
MKRLLALAIVVAVMVLARDQARAEAFPLHSFALALGFALIAAVLVGAMASRVGVPRITGYLLFGVVCGPYVANLISRPVARELQIVNGLAVVLIAFVAGLELQVDRLRPRLRAIARFSTVAVAGVAASVFVLAASLWPWLGIMPEAGLGARLALAALLAVIVASVSPLLAVAVIADSRARGPRSEFALAVSVFGDLVAILLFTGALQVARWVLTSGWAADVSLLVAMSWALGGSIAFGCLVGAAFALYLRYIGREVTLVLLGLAVVLSRMSLALGLEQILAGLAAGLVVTNLSRPQGDVLRAAIGHGSLPVLAVFFVAAGASISFDALATAGWVVVALAATRAAALWAGARLGSRLAGLDRETESAALAACIGQAGITIGLAAIVASELGEAGSAIQALVLGLVAIHEVVGPVFMRSALVKAGEIGPRPARPLIVVSNREPYIHSYRPDGSIHCPPTAGGVAVALDALMRERGGVWIAHGGGSADRAVVDDRDHVRVPPERPTYTLRRIWIEEDEFNAYYGGFANEGLWPLCHVVDVRPVFRAEDWAAYQRVNDRFAAAIDEELADPTTPIFIQDYHMALVAPRLRARRPSARTALFWHIPWPSPDRLRVCPWRREILAGLLANDLLAFQVPRDTRNFLLAVEDELGAEIDEDGTTVRHLGRQTMVVSVPIGVDFDRIQSIAADPAVEAESARLRAEFGLTAPIIGVGVDRLDYTKGIPERLAALDRLLARRPDLRGRLTFVQVGVPSRSTLQSYEAIEAEIDQRVAEINARYGRPGLPPPVYYHKRALRIQSLVPLYRMARFCIVSSLHDGMNLVAKEFVAARDDLQGVLVLSELTGAAQELRDAVIINPYDIEGFADALAEAIDMPPEEQARRMHALRRVVAGRDVFGWASDILEGLDSLWSRPLLYASSATSAVDEAA